MAEPRYVCSEPYRNQVPSYLMIFSMVSLLVTVMLSCAALGTPSWLVGMKGSHEVEVGLWLSCIDLKCVHVANESSLVRDDGAMLYVMQATCTVAFVAYTAILIAAVIVHVTYNLDANYEPLKPFWSAVLFTTILFAYGTFVFAYKNYTRVLPHKDSLHFGLSFYFAISTVVMGILTSYTLRKEYKDQIGVGRSYIIIN